MSAPFFSYADKPSRAGKTGAEGKSHQDGQACQGRQAEAHSPKMMIRPRPRPTPAWVCLISDEPEGQSGTFRASQNG